MRVLQALKELHFFKCFSFIIWLEEIEVYSFHNIDLVVLARCDFKYDSVSSLTKLLHHFEVLTGTPNLLNVLVVFRVY